MRNIDAAWNGVDSIVIDKWGEGKEVPSTIDFQAYFKLLWDDNYLYFLGTIVDDYLLTSEEAAEKSIKDWEVDNFELYWSPGNSHKDDATEMIQVRLAYANATSDDPTSNTKNGWSPGGFTLSDFVNGALKETGDGYVIEASFDLNVSAEAAGLTKIGAGDTVGFNVVACDNDGTDNRKNIGGPIEDFKWDQADTLLRLVLSSKGVAVKNVSKPSFRVYPNPVKNELRISSKENIVLVELYNIEGRLVLKANKPSSKLNVGVLPSGVYSLKATTASGKTYYQKVFKQ